jgi:hypothetical protein|tara:strand:+ start:131 stop:838 length:708 start_codon:yes stop_codon:yes gene_type:complete
MQAGYTHTHILKPTWSRVMHRMHTIGNVVQHFQNSLASITSEGDYPRLITSAAEDCTSTLDGSQLWQLDTWQQGIVKVNAKLHQAQFSFSSASGEIFHTITLTPRSQWHCFECLLKLFESSRIEHAIENEPAQSAENYAVNQDIAHVAKAVNREIIQGKKIICSARLADGSSSIANLETKSLMTQFGRIALKNGNAQLQIAPTKVADIEIKKRSNKFITSLYDSKFQPMLQLEAM